MAIVDCKNGLRGSSSELIFLWEQKRKEKPLFESHSQKVLMNGSTPNVRIKVISASSPWGMQVREINCSKIANYTQNPSLSCLHCKTPPVKVATGKLSNNVTQTNGPSFLLALRTGVSCSHDLLVSQVSCWHFSWSSLWFAHEDASLLLGEWGHALCWKVSPWPKSF